MPWTRITDPDEAAQFLPAWLGRRMVGLRRRFGLLLTSGEVLRITSITALHQSPGDVVLLDVLLDHAGVPDGIDLAWRPKHFLGVPVPGATAATVEFVAEELIEPPGDAALLVGAAVELEFAGAGSLEETIERANEVGAG